MALVVLVVIAAYFTHVFLLARSLSTGSGPYTSADQWPRALIEMIGENVGLRNDVEPYRLNTFVSDHRSVWRIKRDSPLRAILFEKNELKATDVRHPKAAKLQCSIPNDWGKYPWDRCTWHATPDFGTKHIEGVDLYLIAEDAVTGDMIVLHEWIF